MRAGFFPFDLSFIRLTSGIEDISTLHAGAARRPPVVREKGKDVAMRQNHSHSHAKPTPEWFSYQAKNAWSVFYVCGKLNSNGYNKTTVINRARAHARTHIRTHERTHKPTTTTTKRANKNTCWFCHFIRNSWLLMSLSSVVASMVFIAMNSPCFTLTDWLFYPDWPTGSPWPTQWLVIHPDWPTQDSPWQTDWFNRSYWLFYPDWLTSSLWVSVNPFASRKNKANNLKQQQQNTLDIYKKLKSDHKNVSK